MFIVVIGCKDKTYTTVGDVRLFKLDTNNKTWDEMDDLKDTILSVEVAIDSPPFFESPAIASSELGGYIHILGDKGKTIYSYHLKEKTLYLSSMPCLVGTSDALAWAMLECPRLEGDHVQHIKQEKDKDDEIVVRSVNGDYEVEFNSTKDKSHLLNIPFHVLEMVMEYCVGVEYLKFRSTCKICHLAAPLIQWGDGKASKRLQKCSLLSPWLIVFDKLKGIITFTDPLFGDKYFIKTPQESICKYSEIKCSRYGWLLILKPCGSMVFYNPFTSDIREVPRIPTTDIYCFSAPPTSPDCMVVGLTKCSIYIHFVAGEPSWRRVVLDIAGDGFSSYRFLTLYGQDLYAMSADGELAVYKEIGREDYCWERNVAQAPSCCASFPQSFQVRCDEHLLQVIVGKFGESVEVFKLNDTAQEWEKIDGLGKHMIFVCSPSSFCIEAKVPEMENKIYFPRFSSENGNMVFYSQKHPRRVCRFLWNIPSSHPHALGSRPKLV
ncbi:hypothetical protein Tco_0307888 [Tanacetum coccineum]